MSDFLGRERLIFGPWSAFERAIVRLFLHQGYPNVAYTGGPGDKGCDILALDEENDRLVIQCKFTSTTNPASTEGVEDLQRACISYKANKGLLCINNKRLGPAGIELMDELNDLAFELDLWKYRDILREYENLPHFSAQKKGPYPYQIEAIKKSVESLQYSGRALVEMATGLGKTVVMAEVIAQLLEREPDWKVLVLAHSNPIVSQVERAIWSQLPKTVMTHILSGSEKPVLDEGVTVSTFRSLISDYENGRRIPDYDIVLVDECHWSQADSYSAIIDVVSRNAKLMGVTATPWRGDKRDITEIFGEPIYQKGLVEGISEGYLAGINYEMYADNVDWKKVGILSKEGHSIKSLNSKLFLPIRDQELVENVMSRWEDLNQPTIITFCQSVPHAKQLCDVFNALGLPSRYIIGDHNEKERAEIFTDYRRGDFFNLIGVDMLNEGVDLPDVELVVFARITHSRRIFVQQLGRGLRVIKGKKDSVTVLDFVADIRRLGALAKLNRKARGTEFYRDSGADIVSFDEKIKSTFVEEYLADVADLDEFDKPKLDFIVPDKDPDSFDE